MDTYNDIANELLSIEASAEVLKEKCCKARKKLESFNSPAPREGESKVFSFEDRKMLDRILARRMKRVKKR